MCEIFDLLKEIFVYSDHIFSPAEFGFFQRTFIGEEASSSYTLELGYLSGLPLNSFAFALVTITRGPGPHQAREHLST